jgi:hypothetical protein
VSVWNDLSPGTTVTVRLKRAPGPTEDVVVAKTLPKTLRDGVRFESVDGRIFTFYDHDLQRKASAS